MSKPDLFPSTTTAGISVNPRTLERVIPESRRPDGTLRKEIKIRPGFTPQEDVNRFRGSRQKQMDATALPKGHIIGWAPPPTSTANTKPSSTAGMSKSTKKNAKRKEKRETQRTEGVKKVKDDWEDDDEEEETGGGAGNANKPTAKTQEGQAAKPNEDADAKTDALVEKLKKLDVQ